MKKLSFCCLLLAMLLLAMPCVSAAEDAFSQFHTTPTKDCDLSAYTYPERSPLYEKSVVFFGDSLCYARIERGNSNEESVIRASGYAGRIATKYNMELGAFGVSGATVARQGTGSNFVFMKLRDQETDVPLKERQKVDYVILEGGVNDITAQVPLGVIGDETDNFDLSTFAGALQYTLTLAQELYPNAMVGYIIAYQMPNDPNELRSNLENAERYVNMTIEACEKWRIPYLDFFHDQDFNNKVFKTGCITSDGVHMTVKGYDTLSPYIAAWMESPMREKPKEPIVTPELDLPDTDAPDKGESSAPTEDPLPTPAEPKPKETKTSLIIAIAAGAVVVVGAAVAGGALLVSKKKK